MRLVELWLRVKAWFSPPAIVAPGEPPPVDIPAHAYARSPMLDHEPIVPRREPESKPELVTEVPKTWTDVPAAPAEPKLPRAPRRQLSGLRREITEAAGDILECFTTAKPDVDKAGRQIYINGHADLWNVDFHFIDALADKLEGKGKYIKADDALEQAEAVWPIDLAAIGWDDGIESYALHRIATIRPAELRGKTKIVPTRAATLSYGGINSETFWANTTIAGLLGKHWRDIANPILSERETSVLRGAVQTRRRPHNFEDLNKAMHILCSVALTVRYSWHVAFGNGPTGPRLVLPTSPAGCIALFKDRDKPTEGRRNALRHWVGEHYRASGDDEADKIYVRDHLRGETRFNWRGFDVELMVSQFDLEKNELFRLQADQWRSERKHAPVRLRFKDRRQHQIGGLQS